jgi:hypothetical protein
MFTRAFFPVPGYVLAAAMRALDLYGDLHSFIESSFVPSLYPSYFLDHRPFFRAFSG